MTEKKRNSLFLKNSKSKYDSYRIKRSRGLNLAKGLVTQLTSLNTKITRNAGISQGRELFETTNFNHPIFELNEEDTRRSFNSYRKDA